MSKTHIYTVGEFIQELSKLHPEQPLYITGHKVIRVELPLGGVNLVPGPRTEECFYCGRPTEVDGDCPDSDVICIRCADKFAAQEEEIEG